MKELFFEEIDSTNAYLKREYPDLPDRTFVSAAHQSAGRGRRGRTWSDTKGENLLFSLLIRDEKLLERYEAVSLLSALMLVRILKEYEIRAMIKWPNDVYVEDRKIAGILLEAVSRERPECLIVGIGLNVNQLEFPADLKQPAVSMKMLLKEDTDLSLLRKRVYALFTDMLEELKEGRDFYEEIRTCDYLKDKKARAYLDDEMKDVTVRGINPDLSLRISVADEERDIRSGEITFHDEGGYDELSV